MCRVTSQRQFASQSDALRETRVFCPIYAAARLAWVLIWGSLRNSVVPSLLCCWAGNGFSQHILGNISQSLCQTLCAGSC